MASDAEEALRALAVADLRRIYPDGRIIHELNLEQGGVRLDLACVTEDRLILGEVKSDLDTLDRLPRQVKAAIRCGCDVRLFVGEKHWREVERRRRGGFYADPEAMRGWTPHPLGSIAGLRLCGIYRPGPEGLLQVARPDSPGTWPDPRRMLEMLWAAELRRILSDTFGVSIRRKMTRGQMIREIPEHLSGREVRRAVCRQLRGRPFARADDPVRDWTPEPEEVTPPAVEHHPVDVEGWSNV